ncbi:MAG: TonB-dependent receptor [Thiocapsa sp.]|uniref:TonB-dependent receptor plug domain-containing protein n=1 Tax=Thiocapsa sp. TaxID=2024551 RepID=UPI001BCE8BB3|nr:TonB-dependent receptor [Thiocapsa sp.]QVL48573.1 MAG: TonB-dependent receptor [Thiocapsa sp.]
MLPSTTPKSSLAPRGLAVWTLISILAAGDAAGTQPSSDSDDAPLGDLLSLLDQETELATRSGMNADFVPGMATILSGTDLLARGARTVWEALSLVPGISQGLEMTGERQVLSRGVGFGYASGNIKLLLDGVSMNSTLFATANPVLNIPIEQIERIEVIRGPGSSVHGEYAFAGVVNVITRQSDRTLYARADERSAAGGGGIWHWSDPQRDLTASINLTGLAGNGGVPVSEDALFAIGEAKLSNAPGPSNEASRYLGAFADLRWRNTFVAIKILDDDYGDHFGINHFLPPSDDRLVSEQRYVSAQIGQDLVLSDTLDARIRLESLQYERTRKQLYVFPPSYFDTQPVYLDQDYRETRYIGAADLHWRGWERHLVLLGVEASQVRVERASWSWLNLPFDVPESWLDTDLDRRILSLIVQDEIRASERVTVTAALRLDDYSDLGAFLTPRLAAVWRIDAANILKLQYAQAFRPPTFYEREYPGRESIGAGEIATYELGYILKQPRWEGRLILFQSDLVDPIVFGDDDDGFINSADARLRGVELEYEVRLGARVKIDANVSYVTTVSRDTDRPLPGGTDSLANLAVLWRPLDPWTAALQLRYVGDRSRPESDLRDAVSGYAMADLTLSYRRTGPGVFAHLGVKNLTDEAVHYPDLPTGFGGVNLPYPDGYPRPGRRWWLSIGYRF